VTTEDGVGPDLNNLRATYMAAYAAYQDHVAAVALAHGEDEGVPDALLEQIAGAIANLRQARRRYRDALFGAAFGHEA
jgi:hypothetical protein